MGQTSTPKARVTQWAVIFLHLVLLTIISKSSYAQTKTFATTATIITNTVDGKDNATRDDNTFASVKSYGGAALGLGRYSGELQLNFAQNVEANRTTFVRIGYDTDILNTLLGGNLGSSLASVLGNVVLGDHYFTVGARDANGNNVAIGSSNGSFSTTNIKLVRDVQGFYYLAITPTVAYRSVFVKDVTNALLLSSPNEIKVYNAFHVSGTGNCDPPIATDFEGTGATLDLLGLTAAGVTDIQNAIDGNPATFSKASLGVITLLGTISQNVYYSSPSRLGDEFNVRLSVSQALANVGVISNITVEAYNGNDIVSSRTGVGGLLNLDLLGLFNSGQAVTIPFTVPVGKTFDRVKVTLSSVLGVSLTQTLNIHEVTRSAPRPTFTAPLSNALNICYNSTATLGATTDSSNQLVWYDALESETPLAVTAFNQTYTTAQPLTANKTFYVAARQIGCTSESVRVPITVTVNPVINFAATTLANGTINVGYSKQLTPATGGTAGYTYTLTAGSTLPAGLTLSSTGALTGTPTVADTYNFLITVTDSKGCTVTTPHTLIITTALVLGNLTLPDGTVGITYPVQTVPVATGGTPGYTYSATGLPPGLTFDNTTREITGNPTTAGSYVVTVNVSDQGGNTVSVNYPIIIRNALALPNATLANGTVGTAYQTQIIPEATGGTPGYTYVATGLPPGLAFNLTTREITGNPITAGNYTVTVEVTDAVGTKVSNTYEIKVGTPLVLANKTLVDGTAGVAYPGETLPAATGGSGSYTYTATNIPAGLQFNETTRQITGTPSGAGNYTITLRVTDSEGRTITNTYALKVNGALTLATATLPDGTVGTAYPAQILPAVTGGTPNYTYEAINLPNGLTFNTTTRELSGTPLAGGTYTFSIKVTDAASNTVTSDYQIKINVPAPIVASVVTCAGTSATLTVSNTQQGIVTYNWYGSSGSTALATNNNGTFTTGNINSNTVFYVEAVSGTGVSARVAVNVTVNPAPSAAVVSTNNQTINANQSTVVRANVAAGNTVRWYSVATGGTPLATGEEYATGNLAVTTTFYAEAVSAQGCASLTRTPAVVTVVTGGGADCTAANAQSSGISSLLCVLCGVANPGNSVDADKSNYTRITLTVGAAATGFQRLVFPSNGLATDSIRLDLGLPAGLLDLSVLSNITVNIMKNNAVVRTLQLNSSLVYLQLLGGNRFEATFAAGAEFDRVEVRFQAVVAALSSLDIYGAQIVYPNPTVVGNNQTICYNTSATINATANGNTQIAWYDAPVGGNLIPVTTNPFITPNLTATTTYYVQVSRDGCANSERMPITINVVPLLSLPTVAAATITACEGSPVTLAVTNPQAGVIYKWYDAATAGTELFTGATYTISNVSATRTYYVEATQSGCQSAGRTSVAVTVNPRPVLPQVQASVSTVTAGQTAVLTATSTDTNVDFNWYTSANAATPIHTGATFVTPPLNATTSYYVEARSSLTGCVSPSRVAITITVNTGTPTPTPCISPVSETNGVNGIALLAGVSNSGLAIDNDTQTGSTLFLPVAALGGHVYQRFTFPVQGAIGDTVRISINSPGKLLSLGLLNSVQLSTLNGGVAGNDVINLNNTLINLELLSGGTQALLTFVPTKAFDAVEVRLNAGVLNALNSVNINYVQQVIAAPQVAVNNVVACSNTTAQLSVQNPRANFIYRWYDENGVYQTGADGTTFTTPNITAATKFFVTAIANADCESARTVVNVAVKPVPAAPTVLSGSITTCLNGNAIIEVKDPIPGIVYRWYDSSNVYQIGKDGPTFTVTNVTGNISYSVEAFDTSCNIASATKATVQIVTGTLDAPIVATPNVSVSANSRALLTASSSNPNAVIRWYDDPTAGTLLQTGNSYLTDPIASTRTFYVEAFVSGGCASARIPVTVTVVTDGNTGPVPCLAANLALDAGVVGVGLGGAFNPQLAVDDKIETASSLVMAVGALGSYAYQRVGFGSLSNLGDTVKVRITSPSKLLSLAVLPSISLLSYNGNTSNNDAVFANNPLIKIDLLSDGSAATLTFVPAQQFDAVELRLNSGLVSAFTSVDFNYAQRVGVAPQVNAAVVSACAGTGAVLSVNNPIAGVTYRWYLNNTGTPTEGSTFTTSTSLTTGTYNYYVRAVVNGCETAATLVVVTILPTPVPPVPSPANPTSVCLGTAATLSVVPVVGVTFNWYNSAGTLVALNSTSYTTPTNLAIGVHDYFVEALNGNTCANTGGRTKVTVTVGERATAADIQVTGGTTVCAANQVVLEASSTTVVTNPIFKWYADAALTTLITTNKTLTVPSVTANVTYYVTVSGDEKCENAPGNAKSVSITVNPPSTSADLMVSQTQERCGPGSVTLTASSATVINPIFTWYADPALTVPVGSGSPFTITVNANATYYVTVKGDNRCESPISQAKSVSVIVKSIAIASDISLTGNTTTCVGSGTTLTASSTTLISNPIFTWYDNPALTNVVFIGTTFTTPSLTANKTYYVTVKGSDKCENLPGNAATIMVTVNPLPEAPVVAVAGTSICNNNSTTLTVTNVQANTIYEWYNSATNGTLLHTGETYTTQPLNSNVTFYVRAVGTVGCTGGSARTAVVVTVTTRPVSPTVANSTLTTCTNGSVVLAVSNPVTGVTYTWYTALSNGTVVGTGATLTIPNVTANASYFVEASIGSCASLTRARVDVIVGTPPSAPTNVTVAASDICAGSSTVLTVNNPDLNLTYRWYTTPNGGTPLHTGTTYTTPALSATTTFYVEAVSAGGTCVSATRTAVTVNVLSPLPAPVVTATTITSNSILFTWPAVPGAASYSVSIDAGLTWIAASTPSYLVAGLAQGQNVTIVVRALGASPCLTSANSNAITATTSEPFKDELYIPNTFTPNNDGRNDFFLAYGNNVAKFRMRVYNQWGEFVFESQNLLQGWDGTYRGRNQPTGVYVYYVDVTFNSGTVKTFKGTITLLR
ncbi:putative Ig domain-containing protein [Pedobacter xixiisoli]|uniref:Gliding motility-associated C-terminal domain-containing protein n=1 Tax=Pedobacter xixiisoli TaxID=1476464 RepID=A0A285ZR68_9SPHI|nr:putative Ig domain-containing protein [Pedobacter xixiisoli]SOD12166.1 gliding motility-associated C-terminal domain-containing protein [Pedobacter xixiisoli]